MGSRSCVHCHEDISEFSQVCPRCGTWEPFSPHPSGEADVPAHIDSTTGEEFEGRQEGGSSGLGGFFKDVAINYAIGCGGCLVAIVVVIIIVAVVSICGVRGSGLDRLECQEEYDDFISVFNEDDSPHGRILKVTASQETDRIAWDKRMCPGVAETAKGEFEVWLAVIDETSEDWTFEFQIEPLKSEPLPVSPPDPRQ